MTPKPYPIGLQDFKEIISNGYVYVDKTQHIHHLLNTYKYCFISRPRRFGKSLLVSTLYNLFKGEQALFEGLYLADHWDFQEYPVIRMSFSEIGYREIPLEQALQQTLDALADDYGLQLHADTPSLKFKELIHALFAKYQRQVVILIDEYDKPIIDYLDAEHLHQARENRDILKSFYSIIKDADAYLKFFLLTGVSRFSKVSIFSDLNNLSDLSVDLRFNELCGISQVELEANFPAELQQYDKEKIKTWYNGYKFHVEGQTVYNPFSLLSFFSNGGDYQNFWYSTGTPTFLMKLCREQHFYKFDTISINQDDLGNFDIENLKIVPILFQTGYLTVVGANPLLRNYKLSFPNREVRESYLRNLADQYIGSSTQSSNAILESLLEALTHRDTELLQSSINQAFAAIPYDLWQKENEQYYHALVHLLFSLLNVYIFSEVHTQRGRADTVIIHEGQIYCLEFKLDQSAEAALTQIKARGYTERFQGSGKPLHHIGINFSSALKAVEGVLWEAAA